MNFGMYEQYDTCDAYRQCSCDSYKLPFLSQPFCPSVGSRRRQTRQRLAEHSNTGRTQSRKQPRVVDSLTVVGKRLSVGSKEVSLFPARYERLSAIDYEHRPSTHADHDDRSAAICYNTSLVRRSSEVTKPVANNDQHFNCCESCSCRSEASTTDEGLCQTTSQPCTCRLLEQPCLNDIHDTNECAEIDETEISHNAAAATTYNNACVDQNHLLKLLRKFDTIRQRARAAREACHFRFERRQKQRLHLFDFADSEYQKQTEACQEINNIDKSPLLANDEIASAVATCYNIGLGIQSQETADVKLRDIIDLCGRVRSETSWPPPLLDDENRKKEPTDAVIGRLMSRFEQIRLDSVSARLENQKRFENKRKQRKYKI